MTSSVRLMRSWLFVPGHNQRFLERALETDADAVILDLEDSVPAAEKPAARGLVSDAVGRLAERGRASVWVRVNPVGSPWWDDDIDAVTIPGLDGIRLPKVDGPDALRAAARRLEDRERSGGIEPGRVLIVPGIESASGVAAAFDIASVDPRVHALGFGAADFCADIGADISWEATLLARSSLVLASRRAGIAPPVDGAYLDLDDEAGLRASTRAARGLGFFGRSAIHPRQVAVINEAFTPDVAEVARAEAIIAADGDGRGGAHRLPSGEFVDAPVVRRARQVVDLAARVSPGRDHDAG